MGPIPAVPLSWSPRLVRPETLRRHLSVTLPLTESRDEILPNPRGAGVIRFSNHGAICPGTSHMDRRWQSNGPAVSFNQ